MSALGWVQQTIRTMGDDKRECKKVEQERKTIKDGEMLIAGTTTYSIWILLCNCGLWIFSYWLL